MIDNTPIIPNQEQQSIIFRRINYVPSPAQEPVHRSTARLRLVAGGERSGKSQLSANDLTTRMPFGKLFWLVAADYERTTAEYNYICENLGKLQIGFDASKRVDPGEILIEGGIRIATKSAKDPRKLAMEAPDGILACEASQLDYETFLRLRGRLAEKRGWMLMSGTFETSLGWYVELFNLGKVPNSLGLESFSMPTWSNIAVFPGGREDHEIKAVEDASSVEWFLERFGGIPTPPKGLVLHEFRNEVHTGIGDEYEFDPTLPVYLWVDPGYANYCAVEVAQKQGGEIYIVDEIYEKGFITSEIIDIARQRPWWNKVVGGTIDIAGTQHQAMPAPVEVWLKEAGIHLLSQKVKLEDGIECFKSCLKVNPITHRPQIHFNTRCRGVISEMGGCPNPEDGKIKTYRWRVDKEGTVVGSVPEDKHNHGIKAVTYGLVDLVGFSVAQRTAKTKFI